MIKMHNQQVLLTINRAEKKKLRFNNKRKKKRNFYNEAKELVEVRKELVRKKMKD